MLIAEKIKNWSVKFNNLPLIVKLQNLPESQKRIIFWAIMVFSFVVLFFLQFQITKRDIAKFQNPFNSFNLMSNFSRDISLENSGTQINITKEILQDLKNLPKDDFLESEIDYFDNEINHF